MKILIVKMSSLGDLIHTFPVIQYLKQQIPYAEIDWVVEAPFAELIQAHPKVNQVITVQTKKWRSHPFSIQMWKEVREFRKNLRQKKYDLVLDLQGNTKSAFVTLFAKSSKKVGFGSETVPEWPNILATHQKFNPPKGANIRQDYLFLAQSALKDFSPFQETGVKLKISSDEEKMIKDLLLKIEGLKILVCPGSNWPNKQLSEETLTSFLKKLSTKYSAHFLFLWGTQAEKILVEKISLSFPKNFTILDKIALPTLQNLMASCDLVIAMDSLPLHLAGTTSTPTYSLFGPSSSSKYKPLGDRHHAYQGSCPYGQHFEKRCDILRTCKTGACMKVLGGEQIFAHFEEWWQ